MDYVKYFLHVPMKIHLFEYIFCFIFYFITIILQVLTVTEVGLTEIPLERLKSGKIHRANLSSNLISAIPDDISKLKELVTLLLSNNCIPAILRGIGGLSKLKQCALFLHISPLCIFYPSLSISNNKLRFINDNLSSLSQNCYASSKYRKSSPAQRALFAQQPSCRPTRFLCRSQPYQAYP